MDIAVVFTTFEETKFALRRTLELGSGLNAEIVLIVAQVVPFPLPLVEPPVSPSFTTAKLSELADATQTHPSIHIYICRDRFQTLYRVLQPDPIIVVGLGKTWFPKGSDRLIRALRKLGHHVIPAVPGITKS